MLGSDGLRTFSDGMKWLLLSVLVSLSRGEFCSNSVNCSCQEIGYHWWEIRCPSSSNPKFITRVDLIHAVCRVECHDASSWYEFGYLSSLLVADGILSDVTFERCPLPDDSFDFIIWRLGLGTPHYLTFTSYMNLSFTLTRRHLSMLSAVSNLNLSLNGLTELPSDLFRDVRTLEKLDLSFNKISVLPGDIFQSLSELWTIDLSYNALRFVDWWLFRNCTILNEISLSGNRLTILDHRTFRDMKGLFVIKPPENPLEPSPRDIQKYATGLRVDISGNRFTTLPGELFSRTEMMQFTLSHNYGNLTTLPENFLNNLLRLEEVILIQNNLTSLPENIFWGSISVRRIDLHGNALSTLPKSIFRDSRALSSLDLSDNGLNYLPEGLFSALSRLQQLNLARNDIASLSENIFGNLHLLLELDLGFNKITNIHRTTFHKLPNIQVIRLSHNFVDLGNPDTSSLGKYFHGASIQEIYLDHNNVTGMFLTSTFDSIPLNPKLVNLSHNQISSVDVSRMVIVSRDEKYDLRHNNLSNIYTSNAIASKVNILVDDNPLHCGCTMYDSLKYMHEDEKPRSGEKVEIILENASCSEPYWMMGTPVASLRLETFTCRPDDDNRYVRCVKGCDCWWRPHDKTRIVDCSSRNLREIPDEIIRFIDAGDNKYDSVLGKYVNGHTQWFDWCNTRVELNLTNNLLSEIPTLNGLGYEHVESLILSYNKVSRLSFDVLPPRLKILRVDNNDLRTLNATTTKAVMESTSLKEVNLEKSPWSCDAKTRNILTSLGEKFRGDVRYSFDTKTCLDSRQTTSSEKSNRLYISFVRF